MKKKYLNILILAVVTYFCMATTSAFAEKIRVTNIKLTPKIVPCGGVFFVSCKIFGLEKPRDWGTVLVYPAGKGRKGNYVARSKPKAIYYKKNTPGQAMNFRGFVDLGLVTHQGDYNVWFYAHGIDNEIGAIKLGTIRVDNSTVSESKPVITKNKFSLVGIEPRQQSKDQPLSPENKTVFYTLKNPPEKLFGKDKKTGRYLVPLNTSDEKFDAIFYIPNNKKYAAEYTLDYLISDGFWRGQADKVKVLVGPGGGMIRIPIENNVIKKYRQTWELSNIQTGRIRAKLFCKNKQIGILADSMSLLWLNSKAPRKLTKRKIPKNIGKTKTDPVWGELELVDAINCAKEKPLLQGAKALRSHYSGELLDYHGRDVLNFDWILTYHDKTHKDGFTKVKKIFGTKCRTADNWGWFAYEMGKDMIQSGNRYLLEIEYPQDEPRTFAVYNNSVHSPGFHTGNTLGDSPTRQRFSGRSNLPLSGKFETWQGMTHAKGDRHFVSIHSMGDSVAPFSKGIAVKSIKLYRIKDPIEKLPAVQPDYPKDLPRRKLIFLQEDTWPANRKFMEELKHYGFNTISPIALHYGGKATGGANKGWVGWKSPMFRSKRFRQLNAPQRFNKFLEHATELGLDVIPMFEYAGSARLPKTAIAIQADGKKCKYYWGTKQIKGGRRAIRRIDNWYCIDIAHPEVAKDICRMIEEWRPFFKKYPNIKGIELTQRFASWQISYSDFEINRFAKETSIDIPGKTTTQRAKWIQENKLDEYYHFFYKKKREVLLAARDKLQSIRPDLKLYILQHYGDDHMPFGDILFWGTENARGKRDEFLAQPGVVSLPEFNDTEMKLPNLKKPLDLRKLIEDYRRPDQHLPGIHPPLYLNDKGIIIWAPVRHEFTAGSKKYLEFFRTGEGVAPAKLWLYNEFCLRNNERAWCPGLQGTEHAGAFSMMEEILSVAHSDPSIMAVRAGHMQKSFPEYGRRFAKAWLALPALPSEVIDLKIKNKNIVTRQIKAKGRTWYLFINKAMNLETKKITITFPDNISLKDLSTGKIISTSNRQLNLKIEPMQLRSFRIVKK